MQPEDANKQHLTFSKKERICSKLTIERVLDKKQKVFVYPYKCFYDFTPVSDEADVNRSLDRLMLKSFRDVCDVAAREKCDLRTAAQILAVSRVARAGELRGIYP